jgi:hypothetical protein
VIFQSSALKTEWEKNHLRANSNLMQTKSPPFGELFVCMRYYEGLSAVIPQSSALKIEWEKNHLRASSTDFSPILFIRDREGIQTPNPQSRNLMRYSVAPRGHFNYQ